MSAFLITYTAFALLTVGIYANHEEPDLSHLCIVSTNTAVNANNLPNCTTIGEYVNNVTTHCLNLGSAEEACYLQIKTGNLDVQEMGLDPTISLFVCDSPIYGKVNCELNCLIEHENITKTLTCDSDGRPEYEAYNPDAVASGDCTCEPQNYTRYDTHLLADDDHQEFTDGLDFYTVVSFSKPKAAALNVRPVKLLDDPLIYIEYKRDNTLYMRNEHKVKIDVMVRKDDYSDIFGVGASSERTVLLPKRIKHISGYLYADAYVNGTLREQNSFWIIALLECQLPDCFFCSEFWVAFKCAPLKIQVGVIAIMGASILSACILFPWAALIAWYVVKGSWLLVYGFFRGTITISKSRFMMMMRTKVRRMKDSVKDNLLTEEGYSNSSNNDGQMDTELLEKLNNNSARFRSRMIFLFLIFLCTSPRTFACSDVSLTKGDIKSCDDTVEGKRTCKVSINTQVIIASPGQSGCFSILDEDNKPVLLVNVTYLYLRKTVNTKKLYYTSSWSLFYESKHKCRGAGNCKNNRCEDTLPSDKTCHGECSTFEVKNFPGLARCDRTCGCASCGCVLCSDACVFSGYSLVPKGQYYEIRELGEVNYDPFIQISFKTPNGTVTSVIGDISTSNGITFNNLKFKILGTLATAEPSFYSKSLAISSNNYYLVDACELNKPTRTVIGDIQADTVTKITSAGVNNFKFDPAIVSFNVGDKSAHYFSVNPGLSDDKLNLKLPQFFGTENWDYSDGFVFSNSSNGGALVLTVLSNDNFNVEVSKSQVCPKATLKEVNGCFKCDLGSVAKIEIFSECDAGFITISASELFVVVETKGLQISTTRTEYEVHFETGKMVNTFSLILQGTGSSIDVPIDFQATEEHTVTNDTYSQGNGTIDTGGDPGLPKGGHAIGKGIGSWFRHLFDWTGSLLDKIIFIALMIGIAIGIGYVLYYVYQWRYMKKMKSN